MIFHFICSLFFLVKIPIFSLAKPVAVLVSIADQISYLFDMQRYNIQKAVCYNRPLHQYYSEIGQCQCSNNYEFWLKCTLHNHHLITQSYIQCQWSFFGHFKKLFITCNQETTDFAKLSSYQILTFLFFSSTSILKHVVEEWPRAEGSCLSLSKYLFFIIAMCLLNILNAK